MPEIPPQPAQPEPESTAVVVEPMRPTDWPVVRAIYVEGIETGDATFETAAPDWEKWDASHLSSPRLVARRNGEVLGWAALSAVSSRCVYGGVAEVSVYVARQAQRHGVGSQLLARLIEDSEKAGIWTLQAGIFPENQGSLKLHEWCQFRIVGIRERLGCLQGRWRDVVLLERRSAIAGV